MKKNLLRMTSMLLIAVTMPVALAAAPATAAPVTPAGPAFVGALNMLHAGYVGEPAPVVSGISNIGGDDGGYVEYDVRGMWFAMALHTAIQGDVGMFCAVARSGGADCP